MQNTQPNFNLIDVMRGIHAMALCTHLTAPQFTFLINLILKSNELGFKNPLSLTNAQACALSSCESKQGIYKIRQSLSKKKIDGEWLLKVKGGKGWENRAATYEINLIFMASYSNGWRDFIESRSTNEDQEVGERVASVVARGWRPVDHSKIREEEIRTTTTEGSSSFDASLKTENHADDITKLQGVIMEKGWGLMQVPPPSKCRRALEIHPDVNYLLEVVKYMPSPLKYDSTASGIIATILKWAANPAWWKPEEETVKPEQKAPEEELSELKAALVSFQSDPDYRPDMKYEKEFVANLNRQIQSLEGMVNE